MTAWDLNEARYTATVVGKFENGLSVSEEVTQDTLWATYSVTDAPDVLSHGSAGVLLRPDRVVLEFHGERFYGANVTGPRVLKSGDVGNTRHRYWEPYKRDEWPEWLRDLVAEAEADMKD